MNLSTTFYHFYTTFLHLHPYYTLFLGKNQWNVCFFCINIEQHTSTVRQSYAPRESREATQSKIINKIQGQFARFPFPRRGIKITTYMTNFHALLGRAKSQNRPCIFNAARTGRINVLQ